MAVGALSAGAVLIGTKVDSHGTARKPPPRGASSTAKVGGTEMSCIPNTVAVSLGGNLAGAGNLTFLLLFQNTGSVACSIKGYPRVQMFTSAGSERSVARMAPAARGVSSAPHTVMLGPGQTASLAVNTIGVQVNGLPCTTYQQVLVTPPGSKRSAWIDLNWNTHQGPLSGRGLRSCGKFWLEPLVSGVPSTGIPLGPSSPSPLANNQTSNTTIPAFTPPTASEEGLPSS